MFNHFISRFHPGLRLLILIVAMLTANMMNNDLMVVATLLTLLLVIDQKSRTKWLHLVKRIIVIMLTLFAVLAYNTPGDPLFGSIHLISWQGVHRASQLATRLLLTLLPLAIFLTITSTNEILTALDWLFSPQKTSTASLAPPNRLAARIALTIAIAEKLSLSDLKQCLRNGLNPIDTRHLPITLDLERQKPKSIEWFYFIIIIIVFFKLRAL